ncbi:hypothetical protein Aph02nite_32840 [Actinoplanes philippinensis]|uniref:DUF1963 domain-containing protein n=1 Tax=Actinoplanes philippinensis TaxID=35752 RepID=A0A1I2E1Y9_9ACTN|nr:hypothetical protein [Actinoplanes philippinensis]GIE77334.1 hypothetical protein Aph02nite_32840 [Actinoplanes philippinensis]SFE86561.1 hypothetical protein SAMN05421541_104120 [Actinoplanes philippinensis]
MRVIEMTSEPAVAGDRDTVGGWPVLDAGQSWPECTCGRRMALFFQIDVPADVAVFGGEHLLVFQCPVHNDAAFGPARLPERYWETPLGGNDTAFWRILRHRGDVVAAEPDPTLQPLRLVLREAGPDDEWEFRVGGEPDWIQGPEEHTCACGAALEFLAQVPEDFGFPKRPEAPEQIDCFDSDAYGLFLGNMVYLLACPRRCDAAAAWPVNQN